MVCFSFQMLKIVSADEKVLLYFSAVEKVLCTQTFGGLIFALFGGTPQVVLLTTAPLALFTKSEYCNL